MSKTITLTHGKSADTSLDVNLYGATIVSWIVEGQQNIFMSSKAILDGSKAIRGGIPLCFPVFGPWTDDRPQHGFARVSNFAVAKDVDVDEQGDVSITLRLEENELSARLWPNIFFAFDFTIILRSKELEMQVKVANKAETKAPLQMSMALHTYFKVPDVTQSWVKGLKGTSYLDKADNATKKVDNDDQVCVKGFVDRVYLNAKDVLEIGGLENGRVIRFVKENFDDVDVWNPWHENAAKMADMGENEYRNMICVEAVQFGEKINIEAGQSWSAKHKLTVL